MAIIRATKTLAAIDQAIERDQGSTFRRLLRETMPQAEDAYREQDDGWRSHLGGSLMGRDCPRELWYTFHWFTPNTCEARLLRLFNRGHLEEGRFVAMLRMIGCEVWQHTPDGKQFRVDGHSGHYGGSLDAVVRGIPDMPDQPLLGEFKTHGRKSYEKLAKDGMRETKFEHYVQMQLYMGHYRLEWGIYLAVCKDDDSLHAELVQADPDQYARYLERARMVIESPAAPKRLSDSPGFFKCRFCDHHAVCHLKATPARNCRTCTSAVPSGEGMWQCTRKIKQLNKEAQLAACPDYTPHA